MSCVVWRLISRNPAAGTSPTASPYEVTSTEVWHWLAAPSAASPSREPWDENS